jgi:hypothetical protein
VKQKYFNNNALTPSELRALICKFAKMLKVKRVVFNNKGVAVKGTYNAITRNMYIDLKQTNVEMLHTFFHELGHHTAVRKNKWRKYHYSPLSSTDSNIAFDIENQIDQIGKQLWNQYVEIKQWGKYKYSYLKSQRASLIKNFISKQQ